ncbi:MAG: SAP domain-containing protein [Gallionella sp.]
MKMEEIRSIARAHHIQTAHLSKRDLIRSIQSDEGNFDCFATAYNGVCDQLNCIWREDCFGAAREKMLS